MAIRKEDLAAEIKNTMQNINDEPQTFCDVLKSISNIKTAIPNYKPAVKGVSIANIPNGGMELTLQIAVKQGYKLQDVAKRVQDNVLDAVQNMTGLSVKKVNVVVAGIVEEKKPATDLKETKK